MRKLALALCLAPSLAFADAAEDKGWLVNWLQDNLSSAGRRVEIDGFEGALSSRASLQRLTIADDQGVWLTLTGVTLDWSRSALLSGRVEVSALTAQGIDLVRLPQTPSASPEARAPFALPDLPVSVKIDGISADSIHLGPAVLGQEVQASLAADLTLADGAGSAHLDLTRSGGLGHVTLSASYGAEGLALDLDAAEAAGGIAAQRLGIPGAPATGLKIKGQGPLDDFTAQVNLTTDGATRLGGLVTLKGQEVSALLAGDPTPVFLPRYAAFFGPNVALQLRGHKDASGLTLSRLAVQAAALDLEGSARFAPSGRPEMLDLTGRLGAGGQEVVLPLPSAVSVTGGTLRLTHDAARGPGWSLVAALQGLRTQTLAAGQIALRAEGDLTEAVFDGTARLTAFGLAPRDPALALALGRTLTAAARFHADEAGLAVENLGLTAQGLAVTTLGRIALDGGFSGRATGHVDDLTRLALYRPGLAGALRFDLSGQANALTGAFDLAGSLLGRGLAVGQAEADRLLSGDSRITLSALRDETGLALRQFHAEAGPLTADLSGQLSSTARHLAGQVALTDLSALGPGRGGALTADVAIQDNTLTAQVQGEDLALGQPEADRLLAGRSTLDLTAQLEPFALQLLDIKTSQLTATAQGPLARMTVEARLANLGLFVPEFPGPLTLQGTAGSEGLDLRVKGPGQIDASVSGRPESLTARGTAAAALANPFLRPRSVSGALRFDLSLRDLALAGLSGTVQLTGGRFADPEQTFGLTGITGSARLAGGRAQVTGRAEVSTGGAAQVTGSVGLAAPYPAALKIALSGVTLRDPQLYQTTVNGTAAFDGPALGGATVSGTLSLGRTELRIPSTLPDSAMLTGLVHRGDGAEVRATRARAASNARSGGRAEGTGYRLNLRINAPNQVFLRGRGLDAELGGGLTLTGSTTNIQPQGAFSLLRGRMDILGRRLTLSEANLDLQGALVPMVHVVASTETADLTATVTVDGPATSPEVTFASSPALPQEEVVAQLLFGRGLDTISAFQAAQLASAVATLAGRGGDGILGNIRSKTGLDNLDIQTDGSGGGSLTAGKYLSEKLYSEVTVDSKGKSEVSLNLDVARHITLKAKVDTEGNSGAGIFLKKDY